MENFKFSIQFSAYSKCHCELFYDDPSAMTGGCLEVFRWLFGACMQSKLLLS